MNSQSQVTPPRWARISKKIFANMVGSLLLTALLLGIPLAAFSHTVTNKDSVVAVVSSEGLYKELRQAANEWPLNQLTKDSSSKKSQADLQTFFDKDTFGPIIDQHFDLKSYQTTSRSVVDGFFAWLDGKTEAPEFTITLGGKPGDFKRSILDALMKRYQSFPPCQSFQTTDLELLFREKCRLSGLSNKDVRNTLSRELDKSAFKSLFRSATITSDELDTKFSAETTRNARQAYQIARWLPWLVIASILSLGGLLLFLGGGKHALRAVGMRLIVPASILVIAGLALRISSGKVVALLLRNPEGQSDATLVDLIRSATRELMTAISTRWLIYSLLVLLAGVAMVLAQRKLKPTLATK